MVISRETRESVFSPVVEMRLHDQDRVVKWGRVRIFSSLFKLYFFNFLLFQFSAMFSLHENGWKIGLRKWYSLFEGRSIRLIDGIIPSFVT